MARRVLLDDNNPSYRVQFDVASHIVPSERLGEPGTNRAVFELLANSGWIPAARKKTLFEMTGFRNLLVRAYQAVDMGIVKDILEHRLEDLPAYAADVRNKLASIGAVGRQTWRAR